MIPTWRAGARAAELGRRPLPLRSSLLNMSRTGFVSGWACVTARTFVSAPALSPRRPAALSTPSMALRGHEELETLFDGGDFKSCKYRLDLCISGSDSRESRKLSIQQVKKNGNFNGFRKGTVPPFVMKQIDEFVLRDCIETEITAACGELGLKVLDGEAGDPELDFKELRGRFEISKDFDFSCEIALQTSFAKAADDNDAAVAERDVEVEASS